MKIKIKYLVLYFLSFLFLLPTQIFAQNTAQENSFGIILSPVYQEIILEENQKSAETNIKLSNKSTESQQVRIFAYDFKQTDHFGSIAFIDGFTGQYEYSLAPFVSFETDSIVLEPGSSEEIEIKIDNRDSLSPGGHYAAIVVRNVEVRETENQKILPAISALLLVRKTGGEEFNITIRDIGWNPTLSFKIPEEIVIQFENNGNVHDIPRGTVKITDMFGRVVYQGILNENSSYLLPDNIRSIPIKMKRSRFLFPIQLLSLEIRGTSEIGSVPIQAEISFVYFDYRLVVFVFIVVIFSFILVRRNKKIKKINEKK